MKPNSISARKWMVVKPPDNSLHLCRPQNLEPPKRHQICSFADNINLVPDFLNRSTTIACNTMDIETKIKGLLKQVVERQIFSSDSEGEILEVVKGEKDRLSFAISLKQAKFLRAIMLDYYAMKKREDESPMRVDAFHAVSEQESSGMFDFSPVEA